MKKWRNCIIAAAAGILYGLVILLLSRFLICNAGGLLSGIGELAWLAQILAQLKTARIVSPWLAVLLTATAAGLLFYLLIRRCRRKTLISCCVWIPLLLPLTLAVMLFTEVNSIRPSAVFMGAPEMPSYQAEAYASDGESWYFGFGRRQILPDENSAQPLYIAGYNFGVEITGVRDYCEARAVWLDTGGEGVLLIGIDSIALDSGTVEKIRQELSDIPDCASINVYSTHSHASIDTLGLWGPTAVNGKNDAYMQALIRAATEAAQDAAASRAAGTLQLGQIRTPDMFRDSRSPLVYDDSLYQLRFSARDGRSGLRLFFYGAHAEALRSGNTLLSRDFPGILCDEVTAATGDSTMFFPGAIGGLVMTKDFTDPFADPEKNLTLTADRLVAYALSITEETEREISPKLALSRKKFVVPMDNIAFLVCKYLGILNNTPIPADSATGYGVETELSVLKLDTLALALLPGEIFPELVSGLLYGDASPEKENPTALNQIAANYGIKQLLIVGLANDEIGYIVPPSDYLVNEDMPYLRKTMDDKGEDHYEETNSIGPTCAHAVAAAFEAVMKALQG